MYISVEFEDYLFLDCSKRLVDSTQESLIDNLRNGFELIEEYQANNNIAYFKTALKSLHIAPNDILKLLALRAILNKVEQSNNLELFDTKHHLRDILEAIEVLHKSLNLIVQKNDTLNEKDKMIRFLVYHGFSKKDLEGNLKEFTIDITFNENDIPVIKNKENLVINKISDDLYAVTTQANGTQEILYQNESRLECLNYMMEKLNLIPNPSTQLHKEAQEKDKGKDLS